MDRSVFSPPRSGRSNQWVLDAVKDGRHARVENERLIVPVEGGSSWMAVILRMGIREPRLYPFLDSFSLKSACSSMCR